MYVLSAIILANLAIRDYNNQSQILMKMTNHVQRLLLVLMALLWGRVRCEEETVMTDATVFDTDIYTWMCPNPQVLIGPGFKSYCITTGGSNIYDNSKEFQIELNQSQKIHTVFIGNQCKNYNQQVRLGVSEIWVGSYGTYMSPFNTKVKTNIFDTGFYKLEQPEAGKYLSFRRDGSSVSSSHKLNLASIKLYEIPNILQIAAATITGDTSQSIATYEPENLLTNLDSRSSGNNQFPIIDSIGTTGTTEPCYKTSDAQLDPFPDTILVLGIDLGESYFQHSILVIEDLRYGGSQLITDANMWLQNFEVHIGDSLNYLENAKCEGGPFQRTDDPNSKSFDDKRQTQVWNYGSELWCNLKGRYTFLVANLNELVGAFEMTVCQLGIMGTKYVRDDPDDQLYAQVIIAKGESMTFNVIHIISQIEIGTVLAINLRQPLISTLSFVSLSEELGFTQVTINTASVLSIGTETLTLESFNTLSTKQSALMTDEITIYVTNFLRYEPIQTLVTITLGETLTMEVPHVYSEIAITPNLIIEMRQPDDITKLIFVDIGAEQPVLDYSQVIVDTTDEDIGYYDLYLESYSTHVDSSVRTLKTDIISIEITRYVRDEPLVEAVSIKKDETLFMLIPNIYSEIDITPQLLIKVRQWADQELAFVTLVQTSENLNVYIDATDLETHSIHELVLESYNDLSLDFATLRTDIIQILIEPKDCDIVQADMDAFAILYANKYQNLHAQLNVGWGLEWYDSLYDTAYTEIFKLDDPDRESCGPLEMRFWSPYYYLLWDINWGNGGILVLFPWYDAEVGVYTEAYQQFNIGELSCKLFIKAVVWNCDLEVVEFEQASISIEYEIGSGPLEKFLPEVVQKPECNLFFTNFYVGQVQTSMTVEQATASVVLENGVITVNQDDFTLRTHTVRLRVHIDTNIIATEALIIDVEFVSPPPQFNRDGFYVDAITCSPVDGSWSLKLPPYVTPEIQLVTIEMITKSEFLTFASGIKTVAIKSTVRTKLLSGQVCPSETEIVLEFLLTSNVLGEAIETITIPIEPGENVQASAFEGVIICDENCSSDQGSDDSGNVQILTLAKIEMSQTGKLQLRFSKRIFLPLIKITQTEKADQDENVMKRYLNANKASEYQDIDQVLKLRVKEDDPDDELDKSIAYFTLNALEEQSLSLTVTFNNPGAISTNISEPDLLEIIFLQPGLFIDEETLNPLDQSSHTSNFEVKPQVSEADFEEIKEMAKMAEAVGIFATVLEVVMCFVLGKALEAMWALIYAMQFLVYIGMWQISYPKPLQFFFKELKRIALGEFVDDLGIEPKIISFLNLDYDADEDFGETKIGYSRFGSPDLFQSFGPTFYITVGMFTFILLLALLIVFIGRRSNLSDKNKVRLRNLEDNLFFNPVIRLMFLEAIKANIASALVFKLMWEHQSQVICAFLILALINGVPLIFARILKKRGYDLENEENIRKYGTLYDNKNVNMERKHQVWATPLAFFYRRTIFAIITVFLFDRPDMQMLVNQLCSLATIAYLSWDNQKFKDRSTRFVEIATEFLLLSTCTLIQQLISPRNEKQAEEIQITIFAVLGLLFSVNISFVVYKVVENCKEKKRLKAREIRRVKWEAAWKEVEKRKPSRFRKPREYDNSQTLESKQNTTSAQKTNSVGPALLLSPIEEESKSQNSSVSVRSEKHVEHSSPSRSHKNANNLSILNAMHRRVRNNIEQNTEQQQQSIEETTGMTVPTSNAAKKKRVALMHKAREQYTQKTAENDENVAKERLDDLLNEIEDVCQTSVIKVSAACQQDEKEEGEVEEGDVDAFIKEMDDFLRTQKK